MEEIEKIKTELQQAKDDVVKFKEENPDWMTNKAVWPILQTLVNKETALQNQQTALQNQQTALQNQQNLICEKEILLIKQRQSVDATITQSYELYASTTPITSLERKSSSSRENRNIVFQIKNVSPTKCDQLFKLLTKSKTQMIESELDISTRLANVGFLERLKLLSELHFNRKFEHCTIDFETKDEGVQIGAIALIKANGVTHKYHVKTHQKGAKFGQEKSKLVDPRELIVYKWLEFMMIGPIVEFFWNDYNIAEFFIATKNLGPNFKTFAKLVKEEGFYNRFCNEPGYKRGLIAIDLVSKMLFIRDVANNPDNFGFISNPACKPEVAIFDFKVNTELFGVDMVAEFNRPNISESNKLEECKKYFIDIPQNEKVKIASDIFSNLLKLNMINKLNNAEEIINKLLRTNDQNMPLMTSEDNFDLCQKYVEKVKENVKKFKKLFNL